MKKRVISTIVLILLFLTGLSVLLYPLVSDYVNSLSQSRVISRFNDDLAKLSKDDYKDLIQKAREYNAKLISKPNRLMPSESDLEEYHSILDFTGRGVIGTLEIELINLKLPIYLGTEESVLSTGLGHLEGTSLPIGGAGTHSVISGHRGLPSATLLTNLDKLDLGDTFVLKILNETLTYRIDQIRTVEPDNIEYLGIDPDKDYCTLLTCTPYGINSHRLLLRGIRIFPENGEIEQSSGRRILRADAEQVNPIAGYVIAAVPIILIISIYSFIKNIRTKTKTKIRRK